MQDFRVKSGLRVDGNVYGVTNLTVTYGGVFGNIRVTGDIVGNVVGTVSSLSNHTTSNLAEGTNLYYTNSRVYANLTLASIDALSDVNTVNVSPLLGYGLIWNGSQWAPNVITVSDTALANVANSVLGIVQQSISSFQANAAFVSQEANVANVVRTIANFTTANLAENTNLYYTNTRVLSAVDPKLTTANITELTNLYFTHQRVFNALAGNNITVNNLTVSGDLEVQGNTVSINTATLTVEDKNILLANGAVNAGQADGAGITIAGANASITYDSTNDQFETNKDLEVQGNVNITSTIQAANGSTAGALTISGGAYIAGNLNVAGAIFSDAEPVINLSAMNQSLAVLRSQVLAPSSNVLYVNGNGDDANDGFSYANALANIHTALNRAQPWTTVFVKSGDYVLYEQPVTIKQRVGLVGDNLRTTTVRPHRANVDMFYVQNAAYVTGITFRDHIAPAAVFSYNPDGSAGTIVTSPYIQNCSSITTTGTGMRVNGNYVSGLRSMVCDSYTNTNEGGIGIHMLNRGYTQLVSVFTICCDIAVLCEDGGFCSITNSNASFGRLGLLARGVSQPLNFGKFSNTVDTDEGTKYLITNLNSRPNYGDAVLFANYNQAKCSRDTGLIVDSLAFDLAYQSNTQSAFSGLQYWAQAESAIPNQAEETIAAFSYAKDLATNVALNITITSPRQANVTQTSGTAGAWVSRISDGFDLVANIITGGTIGITDRIVPNGFPANTNVAVNNAANLVLLNKTFIQKEVIAYVNQTYPGFFANANNFIDPANAEAKCSRDVGFILDSVVFDLRHDGNRQSIQSGVFYYNFSANTTQINDQIVQTGAAYNFIGSIIDEVVRGVPVANVRQNVYTQNTTAATAATFEEANIVLQKISLINNIITSGPNVALAKTSLSGNVITISTNVSNAVKLILANKDFIRAETIEFVNATLFDPPYQSVYRQNTTAFPAASLAEANIVLNNIDLITDIITFGANAAPARRPISYSTLSNNSNVINAAKIILANRDFIVAEVNGYINRNWANISNGTVAFYTVANSTPLVGNTSLVTFLEGEIEDIVPIANSTVSFHQPSYISALGYTFEYIGSGTNLQTALPYNGGFPIQENEVTEEKGGRVYFTSTDQQGDFRIGTELVFNRVDGTISGRTFTKALFSVMTPYILAVEG